MLHGVDLSNNNGVVDWAALAGSGQSFAICKASEGVGFIDQFFAGNWRESKAHGLVRGAYHFARPDLSSAEDEADFFLSVVEPAGIRPGDLLALDLEATGAKGNLAGWALRWLERVADRVGFRPLFYTYPNYMDTRGLHDPRLADYGLWYAAYELDEMPDSPSHWPFIDIWQYAVTEEGAVPGVAGRCDVNWFNGETVEQLMACGKPGTTPAFIIGEGVRAALARAHDVAMGDEVYLTSSLSYTPGRDAIYWYSAASDAVYRAPKA